jgi:hypothetical protein
MNLSQLTDRELIDLYPALLDELKAREIVKTKNLVGESGEYFALKFYRENPDLPVLQRVPNSVKTISAVNPRNSYRYAIKVTSSKTTGVFHSVPTTDVTGSDHSFEYLLIVELSQALELRSIIEVPWAVFVKYRKIKKPENKWYISISDSLIAESVKHQI